MFCKISHPYFFLKDQHQNSINIRDYVLHININMFYDELILLLEYFREKSIFADGLVIIKTDQYILKVFIHQSYVTDFQKFNRNI